ncbi:hypothetical protein [Erythrobacter tepidarius]|uniref:hypothetical protein n=1 Tax=Erythrobacter tepidarius TaxID=60454 RepID=UPI000A3CFA93|nr:hypothetical protein [Erythrobacter tepidarius]
MQPIILLLAAVALLGAADAPPSPSPAQPDAAMRIIAPLKASGKWCHDRLVQTDVEPSTRPRFEREPATPGDGQMIYAVERRIDGCSMVMVKYVPNDPRQPRVRPCSLPGAPLPERGK